MRKASKLIAVLLVISLLFTFTACDSLTLTLNSIRVKKNPDKMSYEVGDSLSLSGGEIECAWSDGSKTVINMAASTVSNSGFDSAADGVKTVTLTYKGVSTTLSVTVGTPAVTLSLINVKDNPSKMVYKLGEPLELAGGIIECVWSDNSTSDVNMDNSGVTASGFNSATAGLRTVTLTYQEKETFLYVTVDAVALNSISVKTNPAKMVYGIDEQLNLSGGIIECTWADNSKTEVSMTADGVTYSGFNSATAGLKTVTLTYQSKSITFTVTVNSTALDDLDTLRGLLVEIPFVDFHSSVAPVFTPEQVTASEQALAVYERLSAEKKLEVSFDSLVKIVAANVTIDTLSLLSFGVISDITFVQAEAILPELDVVLRGIATLNIKYAPYSGLVLYEDSMAVGTTVAIFLDEFETLCSLAKIKLTNAVVFYNDVFKFLPDSTTPISFTIYTECFNDIAKMLDAQFLILLTDDIFEMASNAQAFDLAASWADVDTDAIAAAVESFMPSGYKEIIALIDDAVIAYFMGVSGDFITAYRKLIQKIDLLVGSDKDNVETWFAGTLGALKAEYDKITP